MKTLILGLAAAAMTLIATPAMAQSESFDGARVGVLAGAAGDSSPFDDSEFVYGGVIGYDFAVSDSFLLGVEGDISTFAVDTDELVGDTGVDVDNRQLSAAVRGTFVVSPSAALFVSGGYTNLEIEGNLDGFSAGMDFDGYRVGAGGEFAVTRNVYASLEYRYAEYSFEVDGFDLGTEGVQSALVGVGLRF